MSKKQKYKYNSTFKIGTILILIFSAIGVVFGVGLFIFGMAWLFKGVFQDPRIDSNITWGSVMMVLGFYLSMMNAFSLFLGANAINKKKANVLLVAIISILGIFAMAGGITVLFTPVEDPVKPKNQEDKIQTFDHTPSSTNPNSGASMKSNADFSNHTMNTTYTKREVEVVQ